MWPVFSLPKSTTFEVGFMLQLSKKVEYGLIALRHMAMNPAGKVFTAKEIAVSTVIEVIEQEKPMIAECYIEGPESCSIFDSCSIRKPLGKVQRNINTVFERMTLQEIL
jgi:DNA-binding IscR family transcriptional regulator